MQTRSVRKPKYTTLPNPPNRAGVTTPGPLRYATGKFAGQIVPTRRQPVRQVVCARCKLPSHPGLRSFVKALGFDRKTGEAITQYVHTACPRDPALNLKRIAEFAAERIKRAAELAKLPQRRSRTYSAKRFR